ncbi:MAG: hypothetical protein ACI8S6_003533 [Myxococcota bacterium]|jgi:hypothetical protein
MRQAIVAGVLGLGVGLLAGQQLSTGTPLSTRTITEAGRTRVRTVSGQAAADCEDPVAEEELSALRALTGLLESQVAELESELYGDVQPWPETLPTEQQPDRFEDNVARFFDQCDIPADLAGFRCEEPPCYAMMRRDELNYREDDPWRVALDACQPWQEVYGPDLSLATHTITCSDGHQEGFTMLAPSPDWMFDWEDEPERAEAQMRRFDARLRQAKEDWLCTDPVD